MSDRSIVGLSKVAVVCVLAFSLVATPIAVCLAQSGGNSDAIVTGCADGERQAASDISSGTWFAIGCLAGLIGYLIAMSEPNPPATQLLGKDPSYVASYTECYRKKGKDIKTKGALTGCLVANALWIGVYVIVLATVDTSL